MIWGIVEAGLRHRRTALWMMLVFEAVLVYSYISGTSSRWGLLVLTLPPFIVALSLGNQFGPPKNWWAAYWGTTITVDPKKHVPASTTYKDTFRLEDQLADWLKQMRIRPVYKVNAFRYTFLRKKHAAMFKLAWG
jgi:hypothetical protein